jgi:hypothetical protein
MHLGIILGELSMPPVARQHSNLVACGVTTCVVTIVQLETVNVHRKRETLLTIANGRRALTGREPTDGGSIILHRTTIFLLS